MNNFLQSLENLQKHLTPEHTLEVQDVELELVRKAQNLEKNNLTEAIEIIEPIISFYINHKDYNVGMIISKDFYYVTMCKPTYLVELYYKDKQYGKCWKLLNAMLLKNKDQKNFIREYQSKVSSKENRNLDALKFLMMSIAGKHHEQKGDELKAKIEKMLIAKIKAADMLQHKDSIIDGMIANIGVKNYELKIDQFLPALINK